MCCCQAPGAGDQAKGLDIDGTPVSQETLRARKMFWSQFKKVPTQTLPSPASPSPVSPAPAAMPVEPEPAQPAEPVPPQPPVPAPPAESGSEAPAPAVPIDEALKRLTTVDLENGKTPGSFATLGEPTATTTVMIKVGETMEPVQVKLTPDQCRAAGFVLLADYSAGVSATGGDRFQHANQLAMGVAPTGVSTDAPAPPVPSETPVREADAAIPAKDESTEPAPAVKPEPDQSPNTNPGQDEAALVAQHMSYAFWHWPHTLQFGLIVLGFFRTGSCKETATSSKSKNGPVSQEHLCLQLTTQDLYEIRRWKLREREMYIYIYTNLPAIQL